MGFVVPATPPRPWPCGAWGPGPGHLELRGGLLVEAVRPGEVERDLQRGPLGLRVIVAGQVDELGEHRHIGPVLLQVGKRRTVASLGKIAEALLKNRQVGQVIPTT